MALTVFPIVALAAFITIAWMFTSFLIVAELHDELIIEGVRNWERVIYGEIMEQPDIPDGESLNNPHKLELPEPEPKCYNCFEPYDGYVSGDIDPLEKSGADPFVNHIDGDESEPWFVPVENSLNCDEHGIMRGNYDSDRFLECPTYKFNPDVQVLMNNPIPGSPIDYKQFEGKYFTHIWTDSNQNMRVESNELTEQECNMLEADVWGFQIHQPNGNISTGKYYCSQLDQHFYAVDIVYWMKGK